MIAAMSPLSPARAVAGVALSLVLGAALVGCGDDAADPGQAADPAPTTTSVGPDETPAPPSSSLPACADVWVAGQDLPKPYAGCDADGTEVPAEENDCSFGVPIVTYGETFYAVPGAIVNEVPDLATSKQFSRALKNCQA